MKDTRKILKLAIILLIVFIFSFILIEPESYASALLDNARNESGPRPSTYGSDDPGSGGPPGTPGSSSGHVTIIKNWYRGISGMVYERTDNSSEIGGVETPRVGIKRSKSNGL